MQNNIKKISLLSSFDGTTGGQAINAAIFSCEFINRGYGVTNICFSEKHVNLKVCGEVKSLKVPFIKQANNPVLNTLVKPVQFFVGIINISKIFQGQEKQKIICFGWGASLLALSSKALFKIENMEIICRVGTRFEEEFAAEKSAIKRLRLKVANAMIKSLYKRAFIVSPISKHLEKFLVEEYNVSPSKIKILYNPRNEKEVTDLSKEEPEEKVFIPGITTLITCGRLATPKGQWHLLRAFYEVRKKIPCKLIIIGDGDLKGYLVSLAKDLGIENDVSFIGWQKNPYKYFSRADIFVLNSSWEGFANVILEAMICGLPVISSDCYSGPREILAPSTNLDKKTDEIEHAQYGILVPADNRKFYEAKDPLNNIEKKLSEAILEMIENNELRKEYKKKSLERAADFAIDKVIDEWIKVLEISI